MKQPVRNLPHPADVPFLSCKLSEPSTIAPDDEQSIISVRSIHEANYLNILGCAQLSKLFVSKIALYKEIIVI